MIGFRKNLTLGRIIRASGVVILLILLVWYVHFQARNFIQGPAITLFGTYEPVHESETFTITGNAKNIVKLTLNGREITTDSGGNFDETIHLEKGYSILTLYAEDRFGRSTTIERGYVFRPSSTTKDSGGE